ncbi:MAG: chromosome segregation protein SMC [Bdellovibrionales bacterium]
MKIKKLELVGFKSFKDRTVIQFDDGITGIVGPNGCGKSNIVDALTWVMGEQSAKHLRGSSMEDVIFAGAEGYAPTGMAEVSLTLENEGGPFPAKYAKHSEIMVTRRLHRSGESEYLINKEQSRLRDIHEIFMDTGVGSKGFSIIEQGAIGKIITAKPEERRFLIEEAAGITKFKVRKRESEKKLASTEQNLVRLADIIGEIKRQIDSLQRQAKKAERYREMKNQARDLDLWLSSKKFKELKDEIIRVEEELKSTQDLSAQAETEKASLEAQVQEAKLLLVEIEKTVHEKQAQKFEAQSSVQKKEGEIQRITFEIEQARRNEQMTGNLLQELEIRKVALETDLNQANIRFEGAESEATRSTHNLKEQQEALATLRESAQAADEELVEKRRGIITVGQAKAHLQAQVQGAEARVQDLSERESRARAVVTELESKQSEFERSRRKHFEELEKERQMQLSIMGDVENFQANKTHLETVVQEHRLKLEGQKGDLGKIEGKLDSLTDLEANLEGFQEGVKNIMQWQRETINQGGAQEFSLVADLISVPAGFEVAMEAVLGTRLQLILSKSTVGALKAIEKLKESQWGRSSFLPIGEVKHSAEFGSNPSADEVSGILSDIVQVSDPEYRDALVSLFRKAAVVPSLQGAIELKIKYAEWTFVTQEGEILSADGIVTGGGSESADSGLLKRRREMKELALEKERCQTQLEVVQVELKRYESQFQQVSSSLENAQKQKTEKEILIAERRKDLERAENELQSLLQALKKSQSEAQDLNQQHQSQEEKLTGLRAQLEELSTKQAEYERESEQLADRLNIYKKQVDDQLSVTTELQVKAASKVQEAEGLKRQLELYNQSLKDISEQMLRMSEESNKSTESLSQGQIQLTQEKVKLEQLVHEVSEITTHLSRVQDEYEQLGAKTRTLDTLLSEQVKKSQDSQSRSMELRLAFEQAHLREANITTQLMERYHLTMEDVLTQYGEREGDLVAAEAELNELRDRISKMGEVSLSAIEEYDELMKRFDFLNKQQADLLEAKEQLHKVIDRIDKICSKQFKDTFEAVNDRFKKVFPVLFGGGEAHLVMVVQEGETDPGIDIVVRPPGKKMQNITLLSGGEKALTSVALIFSIFLVKPSPFCLLDEVDAPLDDANVFRFNELVKEMAKRSQIIIVTHNKYTMEVNNKLYGVTMQERGVSTMVSVDLKDARRVAEITV